MVYSDADYASNKLDRKSFSGTVTILARGPIHWQCKKQTVVAMSTQESEYIALAISTRESLWLSSMFRCLSIDFYEKLVTILALSMTPLYFLGSVLTPGPFLTKLYQLFFSPPQTVPNGI